MNLEDLIFVLFVLAIGFFNLVLPWLRRRTQDARRGDAELLPQDEDAQPAPVPTASAAAPARLAVVPAPAAQPAKSPGAATRQPSPDPRATRLAQARQAIVLRTIIGPCRAHEPFDGSVN